MDFETLKAIKENLDELFADGEPSAAEFDGEDWQYIELYDHLIKAYDLFDELGY